MGLFCCCFRPKFFATDRKHIFVDRIGPNEAINEIPSESICDLNSSLYRTPAIGLTEQNLFDITVQKMAAKMINISALDDQLSGTFWRDRQRVYDKRVMNIKNPIPLKSDALKARTKSGDPSRKTIHERCSSIQTISKEELNLINKFSEKTSLVIRKGFTYSSQEPIVVEFNPFGN